MDTRYGAPDENTVLFQNPFVMRRIELVTSEPVKLPYEHDFKLLSSAFLDKPLEIRSVIRFCRKRTVNVDFDDFNIILFGERLAFTDLTFDRLFTLIVTGIPCVDHAFHFLFLTSFAQDCFAGVLGLSLTSGGRSELDFGRGGPKSLLVKAMPRCFAPVETKHDACRNNAAGKCPHFPVLAESTPRFFPAMRVYHI